MRSFETDGIAVAARIARVAREYRAAVPAPKGAPFFGLDMGIDFDPAVLESLSDPGIFRKYELVLLLGSDIGGVARWLATRLGCRVVAVDDDPQVAVAARHLNERAHMDHAVQFVLARPESLPVRDRAFTHVWLMRAPDRISQSTLNAAFRALRPGGHLAVQLLEAIAPEAAQRLERAVLAAGFDAAAARRVPRPELPPAYRGARERLAHALGDQTPRARAAARDPAAVDDASELVQLHARRPS